MRCVATLLLVALLVSMQAEVALLVVEDEYEEALQDEARRTECVDCPRCPPPPANCTFLVSSGQKYFYNVDGVKLKIELAKWLDIMWHLEVTCAPGVTLESSSLPVFPTYPTGVMRVYSVELIACPVPSKAGGISRALSRLNITEFNTLFLNDVPHAPRLQPDLFAGLHDLLLLFLSAEARLVLELPPELLKPLMELQLLYLVDVRMSPTKIDRLPPRLESLNIMERHPKSIDDVIPHILARSAELNLLYPGGSRFGLPSRLAPTPTLPSTDLKNITLTATRNSCSSLRQLNMFLPRGSSFTLPAVWLQMRGKARCPRLRELHLYSKELGGSPADVLRGMTELRVLILTHSRELRELPHDLFNDKRRLRRLNLANNALKVLPEDIFAPLRELKELDLSGNMLGALGDGAAALGCLRSLTSLQILVLDHNTLGDTCGHSSREATLTASELSPLHELRALRKLSLAHTGASRLCVDWRRDLNALVEIDFSDNNLTVLKYSDMQWYGRKCEVDLRGNPLRSVILTSKDYIDAPDDLPHKGHAVLKFNVDLASSCYVYWAARALREGLLRADFVNLTCAGQPLQVAPLDNMLCAKTDECPERCTCTMRPSDDTLVLLCTARRDLPDLTPFYKPYLPTWLQKPRRLELWLAGVHLASLPDALPPSLRVLDLRNASLPAATERQAAALFARGRDVLLGGARAACACAGGARPALARALVGQLQDVRCAEDGRRVHEAPPCAREAEPEPRRAWMGALSGLVVSALVLVGAWCAARRGSRLRVKAFLLARGLCANCMHHDDDDDCPYDVFIWFSRHDFAVASQIVRKLEAGPRPLRVCVHYRDWRAGESILAQIQRSVDQSRRTLVLFSAHVSRSVWARALRDVTPRLVVALLQPAPPPPALDPELARYVRANTYARWGDPAFWDRLRLALPVPMPPARPRATAAVALTDVTAAVSPTATTTVPAL